MDGPDRLWVADITYIPTWAGFLDLAVVDVWTRRGLSDGNHPRNGVNSSLLRSRNTRLALASVIKRRPVHTGSATR